VGKYLTILFSSGLLASTILVPVAHAAGGSEGQLCTAVGQVVKVNGKSYTCLGVLKEGQVPAAPTTTASPTTTAKPVPPKPIPAANSACTKVGEIRTAPNIIFKCAISGRKLVWQRMSVEAQKISADKLYQAPPPMKTQSPALTVVANVKSSTVGVPISLQTAGGAGSGAVSFIPSGVGCYMLGNNLFASNAGFCGVIAKKEGDAIYNPFYSQYYQYNFEGQAPGTLLISNTNLANQVNSPVTLLTSGGNGNPVIKFSTSNKDCLINGNVLTTTKRTSCYVVATQNQFGQYKFTTSAAVGFNFASAQATLEVIPSGATLEFGKIVELSTSGGSGSGAVSFNVTGQGCTLTENKLTAQQKTSCVVIAKKAADDTYNETYSKVVVYNFTAPPLIKQAPLVISTPSRTINVGQATTLSISGGSGTGAITYGIVGNGCKLSGTSLTSTAPVSCVITAKKARDSTYLEALSNYLVVTFIAVPKPIDNSKLTFAITSQQTEATVNQKIRLTTIGGPTGAVSYTVTNGNCSISDSFLTSSVSAQCGVIAILKPSDLRLKTVTSDAVTFTFVSAVNPLRINNPTLSGAVGQSIILSTTGGNGNPTSFSVVSANSNNCLITGSTLKALVATSCSVTAIQDSISGSTTIISTPVTFTFTFAPAKRPQNPITLVGANTSSVAFTAIALSVSGGSGTGSIGFTVTGPGCSIENNKVVANRATSCSVVASKEGDDQYSKAYAANVLFQFGLATQPVLTIMNVVTAFSTAETTTVSIQTAGGAGNGAVSIRELSNNSKCTINGLQLTVKASEATTCQIVATKAGDDAYSGSSSQPVVFTFRRP